MVWRYTTLRKKQHRHPTLLGNGQWSKADSNPPRLVFTVGNSSILQPYFSLLCSSLSRPVVSLSVFLFLSYFPFTRSHTFLLFPSLFCVPFSYLFSLSSRLFFSSLFRRTLSLQFATSLDRFACPFRFSLILLPFFSIPKEQKVVINHFKESYI